MSLLQMSNVTAFYGKAQALYGVDLTVEPGQVTALMGRNGMGKSTSIKVICRMIAHHSGTVEFEGQNIAHLPSHRVARLGVGLVPEGRRCFAPLTVQENLIAAARDGDWTLERVFALFPRLKDRKAQKAATLSGGEQQMLAIGRALMTNPKLMILDEATEGLAPVVRHEIWQAIRSLKGSALSFLLVDKSLKELATVTDQAVIIERGQTVWSGTFSQLTNDLQNRYLGV